MAVALSPAFSPIDFNLGVRSRDGPGRLTCCRRSEDARWMTVTALCKARPTRVDEDGGPTLRGIRGIGKLWLRPSKNSVKPV